MLFMIALFTYKQSSAQQFLTTIDGWNAYVHLPDDYADSVAKKYPVIIFIPGLGEVGTDPSKMLVYGPSKFVAEGHNMQFMVNGKLEKPIVISIQPAAAWPNAYVVNKRIDSIMRRFRVDPTRISGTGLSMGGWAWDNYVDGYDPIYTNRMAAVVAMSALEPDNTISNMRLYAQAGGKWWGFEGNMDLRKGDQVRDTMNKYITGAARYTLYSGGHCCWNDFYDPAYKENGESVYTWMLKQRKPGATFAIPEANAGNDSSIVTPASSLTLKGYGNDPVGNPINFAWTKIAGPASGTIANPASAQTNLSGLGVGTYQFELKVVNTLGGIGKDTITINNGNFILPIKLIDFTATEKPDHVLVQWKTLTEINSSHFIIERSTDGSLYTEIGRVNASGTSDGERTYQFNDGSPVAGLNFYRLVMVDNDGKSENSNVAKVEIKYAKNASVEVTSVSYVDGKLLLYVNSPKESRIAFFLADAIGRVVYRSTITVQAGTNELSQIIPSPKGLYYARIITDAKQVTKKVYNR
jgi:hypothetical protein